MYFISLSIIFLFSLYLKGNLLNDEKNWPAKLELFVTCHFHANLALPLRQADSGSSKGEAELAVHGDEGFHCIDLYSLPPSGVTSW